MESVPHTERCITALFMIVHSFAVAVNVAPQYMSSTRCTRANTRGDKILS